MIQENEKELNPSAQVMSFILLLIVALPFQAYAFAFAWNSIIQPIVNINLTFWVSMGLLLIVKVLTQRVSTNEKRTDLFLHFFVVISYTAIFYAEICLINYLKS